MRRRSKQQAYWRRKYPGPQKRVRRSRRLIVLFWGSIPIICVSAVLAILAAVEGETSEKWYVRYAFLSADASFSLLVAILALILARDEYERATSPKLVYQCLLLSDSRFGLSSESRYWTAFVENVGAGYARVKRIVYRLGFGDDTRPGPYALSHSDIIEKLSRQGLMRGQDYFLAHFTHGACIVGHSKTELFQVPFDKAGLLSFFDVRMEFESPLGDAYTKEVFCVPRSGVLGAEPKPLIVMPEGAAKGR